MRRYDWPRTVMTGRCLLVTLTGNDDDDDVCLKYLFLSVLVVCLRTC